MKKQKPLILLGIAFFQIFLLVSLSFANGHFLSFLSVNQAGIVSANEEPTLRCCKKDNEDFICQDMLSTDADECSEPLLVNLCDDTYPCTKGYCYDTFYGTCDDEGRRFNCVGETEVFSENQPDECVPGCCMLNNEPEFMTSKMCERESAAIGVEKDWRTDEAHDTYSECMAAANQEGDFGACVYEAGYCRSKTREICENEGGYFRGGLCSEIDEFNYTSETREGCVDGEVDVYYFDSVGNQEGVAEYCEIGEQCEVVNNQAKCVKQECTDEELTKDFVERYGRYPRHTESWCIYDSYIGDGKDTVGSEHWKAECLNKEVNVGFESFTRGDSTSDETGRGYICAESNISYNDGAEFHVTGDFVINEASICLDYNDQVQEGDITEQEMIDKCEENKHCFVKKVDITMYSDDDNFEFNMCVPQYPQGNSKYCNLGSFTMENEAACPVVYEKENRFASWNAILNKGCEQPVFTQVMNDLCISLGDCGSYINYVGGGSNNAHYGIAKGFKLNDDGEETDEASDYYSCETNGKGDSDCKNPDYTDYTQYKDVDYDQYVPIQGIEHLTSTVLKRDWESFAGPEEVWGAINDFMGIYPGSLGALLGGTELGLSIGSQITLTSWVSANIGTAGIFAVGTLIGTAVAHYVMKIFGVSGPAATIGTIGGGLTGGVAILGGGPLPGVAFGVVGTILFWLGIAAVFGSLILGGASYETRYVEFHCNPWQAPAGGENCHLCYENPLKPCDKYRCESLGAACYVPDDWESYDNPPCLERDPTDNIAPEINYLDVLTQGFRFTTSGLSSIDDVKIIGPSNACIEQKQNLKFSIQTNEFAQCKWSTTRPTGTHYDDMVGEPFGYQGFQWEKIHNLTYSVPEIEDLASSQITGIYPNRKGDVKIYVKCKDTRDNYNPDFYTIDVCISETDTRPVSEIYTIPFHESQLPYGTVTQRLRMWTNEAAECKYDTLSRPYDLMTNEFDCDWDGDSQANGWPCSTDLTLVPGANRFYIRCKDQPWLTGENASRRHENDGSFPYTLIVTQNELKISPVKFKYTNDDGVQQISSGGEIKEGYIDRVDVEMRVLTTGGIDNGKSDCFWGTPNGGEDKMKPWEGYSSDHFAILNDRIQGDYNYKVRCEDSAGNSAETIVNFSVDIDEEGPHATSWGIFDDTLEFGLDEEGDCFYRHDQCYFDLNVSINGTKHINPHWLTINKTIPNIDPRLDYYIMCEDSWGNPTCSLRFNATEKDDGTGPKVMRVYYDTAETWKLKLITDEKSKCYYRGDNCNFALEDGKANLMTHKDGKEYGKENYATWDETTTYYIKCEDSWGNPQIHSGCLIVVRPFEEN